MPINHPHARAAIQLAAIHNPDRAHVGRELRLSGCPRRLYTLARVLRAAQLMDEIHAADQRRALRIAIDAKFAADSAALLERLGQIAKAA